MNLVDLATLAVILFTPVCGAWLAVWLHRRQVRLEREWETFTKRRKELYEKLADPKSVEEEMERSAAQKESFLHEARTTAPRSDAGPPAKIHRPPLRGVKPTSWRPQNPRE